MALFGKHMRLNEAQILERLKDARADYTPLVFASIQTDHSVRSGIQADARIRFQVSDGPSFEALAEITPVASPKNIRMKSLHLLDLLKKADNAGLIPLLIAPYISPKQADVLRETGVSWLDLSGNLVVRVPGEVYIERTGRPNRFPDTAPIKKVFQGTASLVARALLLEPAGFDSLSSLATFINKRGAGISLSTVSKVLNSLEQDLLVSKEDSHIRVIDPSKLLSRLAEGYALSSWGQKCDGLCRFFLQNAEQALQRICPMLGDSYVFCRFYAAELKGLATSTQTTMYVTDLNRIMQASKTFPSVLVADEEFGQLVAVEARDQTPWFNAEIMNGVRVVDDIELYLEMMIDTPRGPQVAEVLRSRILQRFTCG
jgi:hypothetical protein